MRFTLPTTLAAHAEHPVLVAGRVKGWVLPIQGKAGIIGKPELK
jgi:hypothetical protein